MFDAPERAAYLRFRDDFQSIMDPERYTITWLDQQLISGAYRLIAGKNAAIIVGLKTYPTGANDIEGIVAAGDAEEIVSGLIPQALDLGRALGCIGGLIESRPAWARILKKHGWEEHQTSIRKAL